MTNNASPDPALPGERQPTVKFGRLIAACSIGNMLEWYDIALYSYVAEYLSRTFFPSSNHSTSLLLTFGTFALGYFIRPFGALIMGAYGDRVGRKKTLNVTIYLMTLGTVLIAVIPPYSMIGIAAPILVLLSRFIQGVSAGGEFGSATAMMIEHMPPSRRGFAASFQYSSQGATDLLAASVGLLLSSTLSTNQISDWGFRLAFLGGGLIGFVALNIRKKLPQSPEFLEMAKQRADSAQGEPESVWRPVAELLRWHLPTVGLIVGVIGLDTGVTYLTTYIPTYSINTLHLPSYVGFAAVIVVAALKTVIIPLFGITSDHFGKPQQMIVGAVLVGVFALPLFAFLVSVGTVVALFVSLTVLIIFTTVFTGPSPALQGVIFPTETRGSGMSFAYNAGVAIFGGLTPFIATLLIDKTGQGFAPAYWLIFLAVLGILSLIVIISKYRIDVSQRKRKKVSGVGGG